MAHILIISSSVRDGRNSHRVALYFRNFLEENKLATSEILDLKAYNFPLFEERLQYQVSPSADALDFVDRINTSDGIIIVTPEYNGGFPASIKNAIDLLYKEWYHKPVAISTVSDGSFGGNQALISIQFVLWKMKAWTVPALFPVPEVTKSFDENGDPSERQKTDKKASNFIRELLWCVEAKSRME
jgi:NAD(P)H-dependent FMN reductase